MSYAPVYKSNQLILGTGCVVIITGWTPRQFIANKIDKSQYAVIGNLYSPGRGINFLVRNLLANPQVQSAVLLSATKEDANSGAVECFCDFIVNGIHCVTLESGKKVWKINSNINGYIDYEIPLEDLDYLGKSLQSKYRLFRNIDDLITFSRLFVHYCVKEVMTPESKIYPMIEVESKNLPASILGHTIKAPTIAEAWVKILHRIRVNGLVRPTVYDEQWQELLDLVVIVSDEPVDYYFPEPNYLPIDRQFLNNYIPNILEDSCNEDGVHYTYGQRLRSWFKERHSDPDMSGKKLYHGGLNQFRRKEVDQVEEVIKKLLENVNSSRAVMSLWDVEDYNNENPPCLNHIWIRAVQEKLSLTATFRSNDMFGAWVANAMGLRALQRHILDQYNSRTEREKLEIGELVTVSQSAHIYDDCWENADQLIRDRYKEKIEYTDPVGSFIVETNEGGIEVIQEDLSGNTVKKYTGVNPLKLLREIAESNPSIEIGHIGYLGIELQKAYERKEQYIQDRP